jgi:hypothetical protein
MRHASRICLIGCKKTPCRLDAAADSAEQKNDRLAHRSAGGAAENWKINRPAKAQPFQFNTRRHQMNIQS